jgi:hypothetical protein
VPAAEALGAAELLELLLPELELLEPDVPVAFMAFARMYAPPLAPEPAVPVAPGVAVAVDALR